ncbi:hypothetical protein T03_11018 [Trichinella britovi]|uniref:Uncharacterized protein n=1 Tax=Trichinella britovi TaxID=45882 RepID=A0A0V1CSC5_TRIBR|nr:hypothetical protein T03_11018 [Trichinella britovi]
MADDKRKVAEGRATMDVAKLRRKAVTTKLGYSIYRRNSNRSGLQGTLPTGNFNAHASATLIRESDERGWAEQYR